MNDKNVSTMPGTKVSGHRHPPEHRHGEYRTLGSSAYSCSSSVSLSVSRLHHQFPLYPLLMSVQCFQSCHWFCLAEYNVILLWQNKHSAFFGFHAEHSKHNFAFADAVNCTNAHVILFRLWIHPVLTIALPFCWSLCWQTSAGTHCALESDRHQLPQIDNFCSSGLPDTNLY